MGTDLVLREHRMGRLYDNCKKIEAHIEHNQLDEFKTMDKLAMKCGFLVALIRPDDPDDPEKIRSLNEAAIEVLGIRL